MKRFINDVAKYYHYMVRAAKISTLSSLCDKIMWMHDGEIKKIGDTEEVLEEYQEFME